MTPVIKAGNCLEVALRYWIQGQFSRRRRRQLDVKSLSSEIGSRAEQTHRRWYQRREEMLALCCLTLVKCTLPTCYPISPPPLPPETLTDSVRLPPGTRHSGSPGDLIETVHGEIQASGDIRRRSRDTFEPRSQRASAAPRSQIHNRSYPNKGI
ncbi:unnamed protein product [Pleuronectes platessa]|uniref:Uncharacterized protein n=1 Tax=Pleuronectes platessa TaxID=8262 RepID=A0A9N7UG00_PLEPL|nr:unnamed protein product [Pleuronectes platessa]